MTGVVNAVVGQSAVTFTVNVAAPGGGVFGYGASGSIAPSSLKGQQIDNAISIGVSSLDFRLGINAVVAQSFFRYVAVQDSGGTMQIRTSASATFTNPGGTRSQWDWSGSGLWTTSHASRILIFYF